MFVQVGVCFDITWFTVYISMQKFKPKWTFKSVLKGLGNTLLHSAHLFPFWHTTSLEEVTLGKDISELSQGNIEILGSILMVEHINHPLAGYQVTSSFSEWEKWEHTTLERSQVWTSWVSGCLCKGPALDHSQALLIGSTDHSWGCQMPETQWMHWLQLMRDVLLGKWVRSTGSETWLLKSLGPCNFLTTGVLNVPLHIRNIYILMSTHMYVIK